MFVKAHVVGLVQNGLKRHLDNILPLFPFPLGNDVYSFTSLLHCGKKGGAGVEELPNKCSWGVLCPYVQKNSYVGMFGVSIFSLTEQPTPHCKLRARRVLLLYKVYNDSALLVLN